MVAILIMTPMLFNDRLANLSKEPVDITPKNGGDFPWTGKDDVKFE